MQQVRTREQPEQRMSWVRAIVLAAGLFFVAMILTSQLPGYIFTVFTSARLAHLEQGMLDLALVSLGLSILLMVVLFLFDPKPIVPPALVALFGLVLFALGLAGMIFVYTSGHQFLPDRLPDGTDFPAGSGGTLFGSIWLQPQSIDLTAISMIVMGTGFGVFVYAWLAWRGYRGGLTGARRDILTWVAAIISAILMVLYIVLYTFQGDNIFGLGRDAALIVGNIMLGIALMLAFAAIQIWFLPVMIAERRRYMPAAYLIVVMGLVPLVVIFLALFLAAYPLVYWIHQHDPTNFLTVCAVKEDIPGSCTFTEYTGYIIATLANGQFFVLGLLAIRFWNKNRPAVILSTVVSFLLCAFAAVVIHTDEQMRVALFIGTGVLLLALIWTYSTRHEYAPVAPMQLGCAGQWLVLGTVILVYLAGFAFFSLQEFFETEALGINYAPGPNQLHDAFWSFLVVAGLGGLQLVLLARRITLEGIKKFSLWIVLLGMAMLIVSGIQFSLEYGNGVQGRLLIAGVPMYLAGLLFVLLGSIFEIFNALWAGRSFWGMLSFFCLGFFLLLCIHPWSTIIKDATLPNGIPYEDLAAEHALVSAWVTAIVLTVLAGSGAVFSSVASRLRPNAVSPANNGASGLATTTGD
jgi:hypothetical protein